MAEARLPDLYRKLVWLTGLRLLVGTALLLATAILSIGSEEGFPRTVEGLLYVIIGGIYFLSLVSVVLLRSGRYLHALAHGQIIGDVIFASGLVYLTGGAESIFTILFPLAIVNAAIGLSRRGAILGAAACAVAFCLLAGGMERGWLAPPASYLARAPLPLPRLALVLGANLSAFLLTALLSAFLAEQLAGARLKLREAQTELEALSALHRNIVRSIASGILTVDGDGRVTFLNPAGEEITGRRLADVRGQPLESTIPGFWAAAQSARPVRGETQLAGVPGGPRVVGFAVAALDGAPPAPPAGHVIVFQDLTGLRRMEEAVRRADRLAAVGKLAAGLAHEIRNPLASMCGSIELLAGAPALAERERTLMQIVLREGERLEALVRDFLLFARPPAPQVADVDVGGLVAETLAVFRSNAETRGLSLTPELTPDLRVRADAGQIKQVLWNLLVNAADATDTGGRVGVRVARENGDVLLQITDSGAGIPAEDLQRIFDPFFTTKDRGTGLGLATVHRIVEAHGGRVEVESTPGRGSTFSVRFPARA